VDAEWCFDSVAGQVGAAVDDSEIFFFCPAFFELFCDFPLGGVVFGYDHNAGCVFVEPVYDAGPKFTKA